ncbi:hypothetical protein ACJMQP_04130 [Rhodopseudomonas palustris]
MNALANMQADDAVMAPATQSAPVVADANGRFASPNPNATLYVGTAGDVVCKLKRDSGWRTFKAMPAGFHPIRVKEIDVNGSSARDLLVVW